MNEEELVRRAERLLKRYDNMRIIGSRGEWYGSARQGFAFNPLKIGGRTGVGPGTAGACCFEDGNCSVMSPDFCSSAGGTYQGDGTDCDPNPCIAHVGACCDEFSVCSIQTQSACIASGGTYQGDGVPCDPDPCGFSPCACGSGSMITPFLNPNDGNYYAQRVDNSCTGMSTYSLPVDSTHRFSTLNASIVVCNGVYTGSSSCTFQVGEDCGITRIACSGEIHDEHGHCLEGCDILLCDTLCGEGAGPGTVNTQVLSGECIPA